MKDIGLVVMLSDNLERHRFVEPCEFVEILGAKAAILSTWRYMLRRTACVLVSLEAPGMRREQVSDCSTPFARTLPPRCVATVCGSRWTPLWCSDATQDFTINSLRSSHRLSAKGACMPIESSTSCSLIERIRAWFMVMAIRMLSGLALPRFLIW